MREPSLPVKNPVLSGLPRHGEDELCRESILDVFCHGYSVVRLVKDCSPRGIVSDLSWAKYSVFSFRICGIPQGHGDN